MVKVLLRARYIPLTQQVGRGGDGGMVVTVGRQYAQLQAAEVSSNCNRLAVGV
jgi:hypothetical protein